MPAEIDGRGVKALVDSRACITVINKNIILQLNARKDNRAIVYRYDGKKQLHDEWANILIICQGNSTNLKALIFCGVKYELLLSHTVMQELRVNLYWDYHTRRPPDAYVDSCQ